MVKAESSKLPKEHPVLKAGFISRYFALWINTFLRDRGEETWEQDMHYELPEVDLPTENLKRLKNAFRGGERGIISSIIRAYFGSIFRIFLLILVYTIVNYGSAFLLKSTVELLQDHEAKDFQQRDLLIQLVSLIVAVCLASPIAEITNRWNYFNAYRLSNQIKAGITLLIFEKMSRINSNNPSKFSVGNIVNYIQVDVGKLDFGVVAGCGLILDMVSIITTLSVLYFLVGKATLPMLGNIGVNMFIFVFVYRAYRNSNAALLARKDKRMGFLKNLVKNIKYIKMRAYEIFFQYKICELREYELKALRNRLLLIVVIVFMNWFNPNTSILAVIYSFVYLGVGGFTYGKFSAFMRVSQMLTDVLRSFPYYVSQSIDLIVSLNRIEKFLRSEELDDTFMHEIKERAMRHMDEEEDDDEEVALEINNATFFWDTEAPKDEQEEKRKLQKKLKKKMKKNKKKAVGERQQELTSSTLTENLITERGDDNDAGDRNREDAPIPERKKYGFELKNLNLKILKGKLVMVIGKIGSGKSSLLYSMLGEMSKRPESDGYVRKTPKTAFLSQNSWILAKTLKENVILDEPFDAKKFQKALNLSQFEEDLSLMEDGIDTVIGEDGQTLSGGQRTRLILARCFYLQ